MPAPDWAHPRDLRAIRMEARAAKQSGDASKMREARRMEGDELLDLRRWWLERIATTPAPLLEKMTLFWHGHFATSAEKVKDGYWMWLQNDTLRHHALGNFVTLTKAISRDPAMMVYLDLPQSRREHPNENWARRTTAHVSPRRSCASSPGRAGFGTTVGPPARTRPPGFARHR